MATTNGLAASPPAAADHEAVTGIKRKRQASRDSNAPTSPKPEAAPASLQSTIADVFVVLSSHDTAPAILNFPIEAEDDAAQNHPAKRAKTTEESGPTTVSRKVTDGAYTSLDELEEDIHGICAAQLASLREPDDEEDTKQVKRLSGDDVVQMQDIMSFQSFVRDVVGREKVLLKPRAASVAAEANGVKEEATEKDVSSIPDAGKTVLSLYGNAPTGRQLFSSFQEEIGTDVSLQELGLPTMLVATKVMPTMKEDKPARTIGDLFAPPSSVPALLPPPKSKSSSNRSTTISFFTADKFAPRTSRKATYTCQPVTYGKWLRYGTHATRRSSRSKERAPVEEELSEEDLFTAAYSSFAPTRDNTRATVPTDVCDLLWWQKFGRNRAEEVFGATVEQTEMEVDEPETVDVAKVDSEHEAKVLQELVDTWDEEDVLAHLTEETTKPDDLEAQALMAEITELIKTLSSHQRIRHAVQTQTSSRTPSSPSPLKSALVGTPTEPTADEKTVYRNLKAHLASLIARLPPYLVAKLDGVQVEELAVSKTFVVEGKTTRGVMEEDQATRAQRGAAAAAASAASKTAAQPQYGQYGRWPSTSGSTRPGLTPQTTQRSSLSAYGRTASGLGASTPSNAGRPSYGQMGSYTAPVINRTPLQPNYGQAGTAGQQYYGRNNYQQTTAAGSPQPRPGQYANTLPQQYQQSQRYAGTPSSYSQYVPKPAGQYPTTNGRTTPGASTYANSPVKLAAQVSTPGTNSYGQQ